MNSGESKISTKTINVKYLLAVCFLVFITRASAAQLNISTVSLTHLPGMNRPTHALPFTDLQISYKGKRRVIAVKPCFRNFRSVYFKMYKKAVEGVSLIFYGQNRQHTGMKADSLKFLFKNPEASSKGLAIWRYKPWNSWTKPVFIKNGSDMPESDVQFYYWLDNDGIYGAALPLSGNGYRSTLGSDHGCWGSKSVILGHNDFTLEGARRQKNSGSQAESDGGLIRLTAGCSAATATTIPSVAIAFGKDPYELFARIYRVALTQMNLEADLRVNKTMPEVFKTFGWCTYNSVKPAELPVLNTIKSFTDHHFPVKFVLIDGGWLQSNSNQQLQVFTADKLLLPEGFKSMNKRLKSEFGIRYTGIWHTLNGDFKGIDPASELGQRFSKVLFKYNEPVNPAVKNSGLASLYFIKPDTDSLSGFYRHWYAWFKDQGFDFTKVDNQLVTERMATGNYPVFQLSKQIHQALYHASKETFNGALMNCMDMTPDAYLNFSSSAVGRCVEDYFPYKKDETYNLQQGNAAAHVLQAIYNSIYFSQMVFADFDMFQSHNPNAVIHALARACSNGPVYCTDSAGKQDFSVLWPLVYKDGITIHSTSALLPTKDCLFQVQGVKIFKSFSYAGNSALLFIYNAADTERVVGKYAASDIPEFKNQQYISYEHFTGTWKLRSLTDLTRISLGRLKYQLVQLTPVQNGFAAIGLVNKYNSAATIVKQLIFRKKAVVTLYEGGEFKAYSSLKPRHIEVNGHAVNTYSWQKGMLTVAVSNTESIHQQVSVLW